MQTFISEEGQEVEGIDADFWMYVLLDDTTPTYEEEGLLNENPSKD